MSLINMKTLFIHIGLPKTGTSFLQEEIFKKLQDINYIDIRNKKNRELLDFLEMFKSGLSKESCKKIKIIWRWSCY